jgi:hypothetical protein
MAAASPIVSRRRWTVGTGPGADGRPTCTRPSPGAISRSPTSRSWASARGRSSGSRRCCAGTTRSKERSRRPKIAELHRREVHRDPNRIGPQARLGAGLSQHPGADRAALAPPGRRSDPAVRIRAARRGNGPDRADRRLGAATSLRRGEPVVRAGAGRARKRRAPRAPSQRGRDRGTAPARGSPRSEPDRPTGARGRSSGSRRCCAGTTRSKERSRRPNSCRSPRKRA